MTHSGGKPHDVGDRGQRYEVTYFDPTDGVRRAMGWTDHAETARRMGNSIDQNPSWGFPQVRDRQADALGPIVNLRLKLTKAQNEIKQLRAALTTITQMPYGKPGVFSEKEAKRLAQTALDHDGHGSDD